MAAKNIAYISSLLGDETRAGIVSALLDGRALTATELALGAEVTPQTVSFHLHKLTKAGLLTTLPQGRNKYFRISSADIAAAIGTLSRVLPSVEAQPAVKRANDACFARTCYGHLAGYLGVAVTENLKRIRIIVAEGNDDFQVTKKGAAFFDNLQIDLEKVRQARRLYARQCLDWSERRPHLGGALGHALCDQMIQRRWLTKQDAGREIHVTAAGKRELLKLFQLDVKSLKQTFASM